MCEKLIETGVLNMAHELKGNKIGYFKILYGSCFLIIKIQMVDMECYLILQAASFCLLFFVLYCLAPSVCIVLGRTLMNIERLY